MNQTYRWETAGEEERKNMLEVYRWVMETISQEAAVKYARRFGVPTDPPALLPPADPEAVAELLDANPSEAELDGAHRQISQAVIEGARAGLHPASIASMLQSMADVGEALTLLRARAVRRERGL